ncbi:MAG TPA: DUF3280 domain-containing protein [Steroidobacteraceae bacterium]|nr:DUF3280 domain-containing protein [Steroidobacteraceae bacterium]
MRRLAVLACTLVAVGLLEVWGSNAAAQQPLKRLLVLDFELVDDQKDVVPFPEQEARLAMASQRLRAAVIRNELYDVIDSAPVAQLIRTEAARQSLLRCNGCELDIARKAGADRILLAWVQKTSNLILNMNIEVRDAETGQVVLARSVDLRGNTDQSWQRGIDFMLRGIVENKQGNR